jgi:hypothetical protein
MPTSPIRSLRKNDDVFLVSSAEIAAGHWNVVAGSREDWLREVMPCVGMEGGAVAKGAR